MNFVSQMEKKIVNNPRIELQMGITWHDLSPHEKNLIFAVTDLLNAAYDDDVTIAQLYEHLESASQISQLIPHAVHKIDPANWEGHSRMNIFLTLNKEEQSTILADVKLFLFDMFYEEIKAHKLETLKAQKK
ncbi:MAG: hypothetical protein PUC32_06235 [Oscillospiraceae bacterium]|nr:hypothetical protein [Oscillospiraceae bacterium]